MKKEKRFKIAKVELLDTLLEKTNREVRFSIFTDILDKERSMEFVNIIKKHKGNQPYSVHFIDRTDNIVCSLHPERGKIDAQEIFELLRDKDYVKYELMK